MSETYGVLGLLVPRKRPRPNCVLSYMVFSGNLGNSNESAECIQPTLGTEVLPDHTVVPSQELGSLIFWCHGVFFAPSVPASQARAIETEWLAPLSRCRRREPMGRLKQNNDGSRQPTFRRQDGIRAGSDA